MYSVSELKDKAVHVLRVNGYTNDANVLAVKLAEIEDKGLAIAAINAVGVFVY